MDSLLDLVLYITAPRMALSVSIFSRFLGPRHVMTTDRLLQQPEHPFICLYMNKVVSPSKDPDNQAVGRLVARPTASANMGLPSYCAHDSREVCHSPLGSLRMFLDLHGPWR